MRVFGWDYTMYEFLYSHATQQIDGNVYPNYVCCKNVVREFQFGVLIIFQLNFESANFSFCVPFCKYFFGLFRNVRPNENDLFFLYVTLTRGFTKALPTKSPSSKLKLQKGLHTELYLSKTSYLNCVVDFHFKSSLKPSCADISTSKPTRKFSQFLLMFQLHFRSPLFDKRFTFSTKSNNYQIINPIMHAVK